MRLIQNISSTIVVVLISLTTTLAQSTGTVTGLISDEAGDPVPAINIVLKGTTHGTATGDNGYFILEEIPAGTQTLVISGVGYTEQEKQIEVIAGQTLNLDIRLSASVFELEQIEVVDQRNRFNASYEKAKAVAIVDDETARSFNSTNAYDALRIVPGVSYIHGAGSRNGKPSRIRGASTWAIPDVIEDFPSVREAGIGAEDGGLTADFGSSIPSIALQSIDIKKGSLGVLYSGDADGGVIVNKIKQGLAGRPQGTLWLETNPIAEQLVMGDVSGGNGMFDFYLAGKLLNGNYTEFVDQNNRSLQNDHFYSGLAKIGYTPTNDIRLEFIGLRGQDRIEYTQPQPDDPETQFDESNTLAPYEFKTTNNTDFYGITFNHSLGDDITYEAGYSLFLNKAFRFSVTENQAHRDRPERSHTVFGNIYLDYSLTDNLHYSAKTGVELINHRQEENARGSSMEQTFIDRSVFYANSFSIADRLYLSGGLRLLDAVDDFQSHTGIYYDSGISFAVPSIETELRASYSTGYSRNKGFAFFFGPIEAAGGTDLSTNKTYEIGIEQPFAFGGSNNRGNVAITLFRNLNNRVPIFSGWGAETVYYEDHQTDGIEVSADYRITRFGTLYGSFTYMDPVITATTHPDGVGVESTSVPVPQYAASFGFDVQPTDKLSFTAIGTYNDGQRSRIIDLQTGEVTTTTGSSYTRINMSAKYRWSGLLTTLVRVENLLNEKNLGYSSETRGPDGVQITQTQATDPGRFASIAVILNF